MKSRIALVVNNLDVGGLEKVVIGLLAGIDRDRFEPYLACLQGPGKLIGQIDLPEERVLFLTKTPRYLGFGSGDPGAILRLRNWLIAKRIDLVHAHNMAPLLYGGLAARLATLMPGRRPVVLYSEHNQIYSADVGKRRRFRRVLRLADHVITVSRDLERTLRGREVGYDGPLSVIYNGVSERRFSGSPTAGARAGWGFTPEEWVIGTGVVLKPQKGVADLLEAASILLDRGLRAKFLIAGDGPLRAMLEARVRPDRLGTSIRFVGYQADMPRVLSALDVFVLPSLWEGVPLALLEALAMAKPIVCTTVGGNPEVVVDGENGFLVAPGRPVELADAIERLLANPELMADIGSRNRSRFLDRFDESLMIRSHEDLYARLVRGDRNANVPDVGGSAQPVFARRRWRW